jgi:diguanylate cyclase (GGDEF)-like protein
MISGQEDARWRAECQLETVRGLSERELHSLPASLIALGGCLVAALALPNPAVFILPLMLRLMAITSTRITTARLRAILAAGGPYEAQVRLIGLSLALAGVSWALLVLPALELVGTESFAFVIVGITIVGVSLICAMFGPLPRIMAGFVGAFLCTLFAGLVLRVADPDPAILFATVAITIGMVAFSLGNARQSHQMAAALVENRQLGEELAEALAYAEFLSQRDPLTGLLNRRAFFEGHCDAAGALPYSGQILAIDLDHFKRINDCFGHATGDRVLAATGDCLRDELRDLCGMSSCAVRFGGEEFVVVLGHATRAQAEAAANRIRVRLAKIPARLCQPSLCVSASIGIAPLVAGQPVHAALDGADEALYAAKKTGRDRVVVRAA